MTRLSVVAQDDSLPTKGGAMLRLSTDLALPPEAVTETFAILAKRGAGKTYTASVFVEELLKAGQHVAVIDPLGVWWGLRAAADGEGPGLDIVIFGGDHGDVPLEDTAGAVIADLIVDEGISAVLDLSGFRKAGWVRFVTDFAERLYHRNRSPLQLILDEADSFAPQRVFKGGERMLGAMEDLVRRGRARGIGVTMVTQRSASINKDILTQAEVLIALRTNHPRDRDAIEEWVKVHGTPGQAAEMMASLAGLPIGEAWIWSAGWLDVFQRVRIRQRETFDSSATPKPGERPRAPKRLADVDLEAVKGKIAATIERAKAEDPKELRRQIAALKRELANAFPVAAERVEVPVEVEVPVLVRPDFRGVWDTLDEIDRKVEAIRGGIEQAMEAAERGAPAAPKRTPTLAVPRSVRPAPAPRASAPQVVDGASLKLAERKILAVLAQYPEGRTARQVAILTSYSQQGGGFRNAVGSLRTRGLIEGRDHVVITGAGKDAIGDSWEPLPEPGAELVEHWAGQLKKAERLVLETVAAAWPNRMTPEEVADATGYEVSGGGFRNALGKLRTLELVEGRGDVRASDALMGGGG